MPCKNLRAQLPLYAGGELDAVASAVVGRHVRECGECRRSAEKFSADRAQLNRYGRQLAQERTAPDVFSGLLPRLEVPPTPNLRPANGAEGRRRGGGFQA